MSLRDLSDQDLNRLYNDAKAGIRKGNYKNEDHGDGGHGTGYDRADFYTGQTMSSDYNFQERGKDEEEMMELSKLYRDNVFTEHGGGRMSDMDIRRGFSDIYDEKERRRLKYIDDGRYKPPAEEPKEEPKATKPVTQEAPPVADTTINRIKPRLGPTESDYGKDLPGWGDTEWNPEGGTAAPEAKSRAQSYSGSNVDYSFNAGGGGTANPPADANSGMGEQEAAAQATLDKWKYGLTQK